MALSNWIYNKATSQFLRGGFCEIAFDSAIEGLTQFVDGDGPDPRLHRFDVILGKRLATSVEIAAYDAAQVDTQIDSDINVKALKALGFVLLQRILGRNPTLAERQALITDVKTVYKTLP